MGCGHRATRALSEGEGDRGTAPIDWDISDVAIPIRWRLTIVAWEIGDRHGTYLIIGDSIEASELQYTSAGLCADGERGADAVRDAGEPGQPASLGGCAGVPEDLCGAHPFWFFHLAAVCHGV